VEFVADVLGRLVGGDVGVAQVGAGGGGPLAAVEQAAGEAGGRGAQVGERRAIRFEDPTVGGCQG